MTLLVNVAVGLVMMLAALATLTWFVTRAVERRIPPVGRFVDVPGVRFHVIDKGTAPEGQPPILMLHGLAGQVHHFNYFLVNALADSTRVIAIDRPGSGYSTRARDTAIRIDAQADAVAALLSTLQIDRAFVVGHSLGGALALTLALRHPQRVAGLALIAPLTRLLDNPPAVFRPLAVRGYLLRRLLAWTLVTPSFIWRGRRVLPMVFGPESPPPGYTLKAGGLLSLRPSQFIAAAEDLEGVVASYQDIPRRFGELAQPPRPIGMLFGREDRVLDHDTHVGSLQTALPGLRVDSVSGGHMLPLTQPTLVARFIKELWQASRT
ncbi:MAG: alpha/beta fold hydrolase [Sinobacteraceae bacterium]|nr:alpha/beta fold hydrolase [Nevskiaceae bacterium]